MAQASVPGGRPADQGRMADDLVALAERAGEAILEVYGEQDPDVVRKADLTPVTQADLRAEELILPGLRDLAPSIPVVAEEAVSRGEIPEVGGGPFWLVDPLDGTKEFLSRNGEFTVNIALVEDGAPTWGVVHVPALGVTYVGHPGGAQLRSAGAATPIGVRAAPAGGFDVLVSRSHLDEETGAWLAGVPVRDTVSAGSSLKFCRIAESAADLYPRFGRTMAWDTAAGHAVLRSAGGHVCERSGGPLRYRRPDFVNPPFVAYGATRPPGLGD